jgi:hypothetical protein
LHCLALLSAHNAYAQSAAGGAPAPEPREKALLRLTDGNHLFRAGDYDGAVTAYREAYALVPSDKLHFNIGLAEKMRGNSVEATRELDRFLASEVGQSTDLRTDAVRYLDELSLVIATVRVQMADGDHVLVDGVPMEGVASDRPLRLAPGVHQLIVRRPGHADWGQGLDLVAGANLSVTPVDAPVVVTQVFAIDRTLKPMSSAPSLVDPPPAMPSPESNDSETSPPIYRRWWFWTVVAGVVAGGAIALAIRGADSGGGCQMTHNCAAATRKGLETQ